MSEQFYLAAADAKIYCRRYGDGEPLVMIHGACVDSDFYAETAEILSRYFTVYTYDRRGYGRSESGANHTIAVQTEDTAALIGMIGSPCHIIAHSGGTAIAMELAIRHPELVRKLMLHEPVDADSMDKHSEAAQTLYEIARLIRAGKHNKAMSLFLPMLGERDFRARPATEDEIQNMGKNCRQFTDHEFFEIFSYAADATALRGADITIGIGEGSRGTNRELVATQLANKLNANTIWFPSAHNCAFDLPKEFAWLSMGALGQ